MESFLKKLGEQRVDWKAFAKHIENYGNEIRKEVYFDKIAIDSFNRERYRKAADTIDEIFGVRSPEVKQWALKGEHELIEANFGFEPEKIKVLKDYADAYNGILESSKLKDGTYPNQDTLERSEARVVVTAAFGIDPERQNNARSK